MYFLTARVRESAARYCDTSGGRPTDACWSEPGPPPTGRSGSTAGTGSKLCPPSTPRPCCGGTGRSRIARSTPRWCWRIRRFPAGEQRSDAGDSDRRRPRVVLVVAADPERRPGALVATLRGAVEQGVVGHRELEAARGADVGPVDDPIRERVRAQARPLRDVAAGARAAHLRVLGDGD